MEEKRVCINCHEGKILNKDNFCLRFYKSIQESRFGNICRVCEREKGKEYDNNRKEKKKEYNQEYIREWYLKNVEIVSQNNKNYYLNNVEKENKRSREYQIKNGLMTGIGQTIPERKIEQFLKQNKFKYQKEKTFEDCRNNQGELLSFDFFLPELNIIVEYDGIFHYKSIFGEEKLKKTQEHDQIKNNYCIIKGIQLIRISYKENLEEVLNRIFILEKV